ncbi:MAG: hypothetical protein K0V04_02095 [Deltaproteobacteria bacterium]|nr:hypothetical protein [Deltaproteobacteria bacterium]
MSVIKSYRCRMLAGLLALAVSGPGCNRQIEDDTWVLGLFTKDRIVGSYDHDTIAYYEFREDQTVVEMTASSCSSVVTEVRQLPWERRGDREIAILPPEGEDEVFPGSGFVEWRVRPAPACDELEITHVSANGPEDYIVPLMRGRMCLELEREPPPYENMTACRVVWCDEPPPACE